jgi:Bacterial Ig domain
MFFARVSPPRCFCSLSRQLQIARCGDTYFKTWKATAARALLAGLVLVVLPVLAFGSCTTPKNPIEAENCLPGTPSTQWYINGAGSANIVGFATDISVNAGQTISFKVSTSAASWRLDIYRLGYYQGNGARFIATVLPSAPLPQTQPACVSDSSTGLVDCGNWAVSASWAVPSTATSGIYFGRLIRLDTGESSPVVFVVRNDASHSDILVQTSDQTWHAYNDYGGNSLYTGNPPVGRAYKVSYNRPFHVYNSNTWLFTSETPMIRWLEANGYDLSYFSGMDAERNGGLITQHKIFMSVAHDEYWSGGQRTNVEAARAAGVNLAFFSGNEIFFKTRWEPSIDGTNTPYRTLVTYKETEANAVIDPADPPTWTGYWRDGRFSPPADGGRPENALSGTIFHVNSPRNDPMTVPQADGRMRFWRNTSIATLGPGQVVTLPTGVLGYEWDVDEDNGFRPAGLVPLSTTTITVSSYLFFNPSPPPGNYYFASANATHHLTMYRTPSGALVFGAGTVQWSWGLDATHDLSGTPTDVNMQQATVNILADMGAQPATLQSGLVAATASTDATPPSSTITSPASGSTVTPGSSVTISGTAADAGGGVVGAVEVSVDGGITWHPAVGRESWSYTATFNNNGTVNVRSRAVDDSANLESPGPGITLIVGSGGGGGGGNGAVVQKATFSRQPTSGGSVTFTLPQATGAGHALIVGVSFWPLDISSVTDGSGDAFTRGLSTSIYHNVNGSATYNNFYYAKATAGGTNALTLNFSGGSTYLLVAVAEVSGLDTSAPLDQSGFHESLTAATPWTSASVSTSAANEYLFSWAASEAVNTTCGNPGSGWVIESQTNPGTVCLLDRIVTASGSYQASVTPGTSQNYAMEIVTFKMGPTSPPPPPTVTSVNPNSGAQGQSLPSVAIGGSNFQSGATCTFGAGITVNSCAFNSGTQLTANITISSTATVGARNVTVTNPGGQSSTLTNGFTVTTAAPPPPPTVTSVNPNSGAQGQSLPSVVIAGSNFQNGAGCSFGAGITVNSCTFNSGTQLTANITISSTATVGTRNVTVTNPDNQSATLANGFSVTAPSTILLIQKATFSREPTSGGTVTFTLPQATGAGHTLIVGMSFWPLDISSVTDGSGDAFTRGLSTSIYHNVNGSATYNNFYYAKSTAGGTNSLTLNFSGGSTYLLVAVTEVAGLNASAPVDQSGYNESLTATAAWSSAAVTTTAAKEYLFLWAASEAGNASCSSPASGWAIESQTNDPAGATVCVLDRIVSATGSYSAAVTASAAQNYAMEMVTFKGAP